MPCIQPSRANHQLVKSCCTTGCGCDGNSFFANAYCPCNDIDNPAPRQNSCLEDALCAFLGGLASRYGSSDLFYIALNSLIATFTTTCTLCPGQTATIIATDVNGNIFTVGTVTPGTPSTIIDGATLPDNVYNFSVIGGSSTTPCKRIGIFVF